MAHDKAGERQKEGVGCFNLGSTSMGRKCEYPLGRRYYMEDRKGRLFLFDSLPIFAGSRPDSCPVEVFTQEVHRGMAAMNNIPTTSFEFTPEMFVQWIANALEGEAIDHFDNYLDSGGLCCPHALLDSITCAYVVPKRGSTSVKQRVGRRSAITVRVAPSPVLSTSPPVPAVSKRRSSIPVRLSLGQPEEMDLEWDEDVPLPTFLFQEPPAPDKLCQLTKTLSEARPKSAEPNEVQAEAQDATESGNQSGTKSRPPPVCWGCGQPGHHRVSCPNGRYRQGQGQFYPRNRFVPPSASMGPVVPLHMVVLYQMQLFQLCIRMVCVTVMNIMMAARAGFMPRF